MKHFRQLFLIFACITIMAGTAFSDVTATLTSPIDGSVLAPCTDVELAVDIATGDSDTIKYVRFLYNDRQKYRDRSEPWSYTWQSIDRGVYNFYAIVTTTDGREISSDTAHVKVGQISNGEVLFNGSFDCGKMTNWGTTTHEGAVASFDLLDDNYFDDQYYLYVDITNGGAENWHVQLSTICPTDSGHVYEVSFWADAFDPKSIYVALQENQDPWIVQADATVDIEGPDLYGFDFIATKTDPTNYIRFNIGGNTTPFYIDDVRVIDHSRTGVTARHLDFDGAFIREYELKQAYPNPFNMNTTIRYRLSHAADIRIDVFDLRGRTVAVLDNGFRDAGAHSIQWDGTTLNGSVAPSGVYFFRMTGESIMHDHIDLSQKIVLIK